MNELRLPSNGQHLTLSAPCLAVMSLFAVACAASSSDPLPSGSGGSVGTLGSGGGPGTGGTVASGGAKSTGGVIGSGGMASASGGKGGIVATGGAGAAGKNASGGSGTAGNMARGGTSGSGTGGASSTGGATGVGGSSAPTAGCGKATWPVTNDQSGSTPYTLSISGKTREYYVNVPAAYNANQPTRVIFAWHWLGGTARNITGGGGFGGAYYGLKARIPDAIYIAAEGLSDGGQTGWANTGGQDIAFLKGMLEWIDANYCVDKGRILSTGFSYGGIMSDTIACQMGSTFRAVAPVAGVLFSGTGSCVNQRVAAIMTHGSADSTLAISGGITARDYLIKTNHCTMTSQPVEPSPCVAYSGCDAGYPVVWCEHTGGHTVPSFASAAIGTFFQQF